MVVFPNAKINIGLNILRRRSDGFHDIQTIFYPIELCDILEVVENNNIPNDYEITFSGINIDDPIESNLVIKAYLLLKNDFRLPKIQIHLHKRIPFGAGLGGGSSDAAFMLKLLNELFGLNIETNQLKQYAAMLGADCTFFIENKPCYATQKGDLLEPVELDLSKYKIYVAKPDVNMPTKEAYSLIKPNENVENLKELINQPIENWKTLIFNDFEQPVSGIYPVIKVIKNKFYEKGAIFSQMTGSGTAVFGIFDQNVNPELSGIPIVQ